MTEITKTLLQSPLLYIVTLIVVLVLLRKGYLNIHTDKISLGKNKEEERRIIANQISYIGLVCERTAQKLIIELPHINQYHLKYVVEKVVDEFVRRCSINHITCTDIYVEDTALTVLAIVQKRAKDPYFWTESFEQFVRAECLSILKHLVDIRKRIENQ